MYRNLNIFLSLAIFSLNGICQSPSTNESNTARGAVLVGTDKLKIELQIHGAGLSPKVFVVFSNASKSTLWFPVEPKPANRVDAKAHMLEIWYGYFDKVYGPYKGHYMLPKMHPVQPGEKFKLELASPEIVQVLLKARMKTRIQVRVATMAFTYSQIRGDQPLDDYITNSIVVDSLRSASKFGR